MKQADKPKNLTLYEARSRGWHFDVDLSQGGSGLKGGMARGDKHIIDYITELVGTENAHIVVNKALHLNGALIASAQTDEQGNYTDKGKLQLIAGELITQNFHEYDSGHTLNAALNADMSYASSEKTGEQVDLEGSYKDMERKTPATIGKGEIRILKEGNHELNRDLRQARREALRGENFRSGFCYDTAKSYLDIAAEFASNLGDALGITHYNAQDFTLGTGTEPEEPPHDDTAGNTEEETQGICKLGDTQEEVLKTLGQIFNHKIKDAEPEEQTYVEIYASAGQTVRSDFRENGGYTPVNPISLLIEEYNFDRSANISSKESRENRDFSALGRALHRAGEAIMQAESEAYEFVHGKMPLFTESAGIVLSKTNELPADSLKVSLAITKGFGKATIGESSTEAISEELSGFGQYLRDKIEDYSTAEQRKAIEYLALSAGFLKHGFEAYKKLTDKPVKQFFEENVLYYPDNVADYNKLKLNLATQAQAHETGVIIAGVGDRASFEKIGKVAGRLDDFRDAEHKAKLYGGEAGDYVKKSSLSYHINKHQQISTHWVENIKTGARYEFKTIVEDYIFTKKEK